MPLERIERTLSAKVNFPMPASALNGLFRGRSLGSGGFLAAALRAEGLLAPDPSNPVLSVRAGDLEEWKRRLLGLKASDGDERKEDAKPA